MNAGHFTKGADARRHAFTKAECRTGGTRPTCHRLTAAHRRMGGLAAFARTMAELRMDMHLPLPDDDAVRAAARRLIRERLTRLGKLPPRERAAERVVLARIADDYDLDVTGGAA